MGTIWIELQANEKAQKHKNTWKFARLVQKEIAFELYNYSTWKGDLFWEFQVQKSRVDPDAQATSTCFGRKTLPHAAYSPDLAPSDYHLFASMGHALTGQHFGSYEDIRKWLGEWFTTKEEDFPRRRIHKWTERWTKCITSDILNKVLLIILTNLTWFFRKKSAFHTCTPGNHKNRIKTAYIGKYNKFLYPSYANQ